MKSLFKYLIIFVVLGIVSWVAYSKWQPENKISYITEPVQRGRISQTVSATGEISSSHLVDVGAQASGQIKKMHVKEGQVVQKGDLIAEIDSTTQINTLNTHRARLESYKAQLESAQIALRTAQRKYDRYKLLKSEDAVSKEEFENTEDALASAKSKIKELQSTIRETQIAINTAETDVGYTRIVAPIDGTIVAVMAEEGQTVNANQTTPNIVQLANLELMENKMQIAEGDATKVKAGQNFRFTILSEPDAPFSGVLDSIDPGLTTMSQGSYSKSTDTTSNAVYYYARALIPNEAGKLAIGMTTQNTIEIASVEDVLVVPTIAVKSGRDGKKTVSVLENNQAVEKNVETGLKDSMNTEIKSGLKEGDQIIMSQMDSNEKAQSSNRNMRMGPPR